MYARKDNKQYFNKDIIRSFGQIGLVEEYKIKKRKESFQRIFIFQKFIHNIFLSIYIDKSFHAWKLHTGPTIVPFETYICPLFHMFVYLHIRCIVVHIKRYHQNVLVWFRAIVYIQVYVYCRYVENQIVLFDYQMRDMDMDDDAGNLCVVNPWSWIGYLDNTKGRTNLIKNNSFSNAIF